MRAMILLCAALLALGAGCAKKDAGNADSTMTTPTEQPSTNPQPSEMPPPSDTPPSDTPPASTPPEIDSSRPPSDGSTIPPPSP